VRWGFRTLQAEGRQAGDLPVQQPTEFELAIKMKTAKAVGITFLQTSAARRHGDRVAMLVLSSSDVGHGRRLKYTPPERARSP
jgi:hypothetical protein